MATSDGEASATRAEDWRAGHVASCVLELLDSAEGALDCDMVAARDLIVRARALLEVALEPAPPEAVSGGLRPWQIRKIEAFVRERLPDAIRVGELCREARMSPSHFSRIFKKSLGETPQAYVRRQRLERACRLMLVTTLPLTEIALACGYTDHAHFSRNFRAVFDLSPAAWRREQGAMTAGQAEQPRPDKPHDDIATMVHPCLVHPHPGQAERRPR